MDGEPVPKNVTQEAIKKELVDPRSISKKHDPEGRSATAGKVLEARTQIRSTREGITEKESKLELVGTDLTQRAESSGLQRELELLKTKLSTIPDVKELLQSYYEKVEITPLTNQEKRELLTPEALASLSTKEYIFLWRRLNPHFLSHVTRQGFRDHAGDNIMLQHNSGYREFINGFVDVMGNGRSIFPPLARMGLVNRDKATVKLFVSNFLSVATSADQAKNMFLNFLNIRSASAPRYPDKTAVHLAAEMVSDEYYGGEGGNEVFFVFPTDILASQYAFAFGGGEKDFTSPQSDIKWNDVFIWTDLNHPGIPVDSGIVFLAEKTPVDPETGSKYASETRVVEGQKKRVIIEDTALVSSFVEWGEKIDDQSLLKRAFTEFRDERNNYRRQDLEENCFATFVRELQVLGFAADSSATLASKLIGEMFWRDSFDEEALQGIVKSSCADLKRAVNTIPAKEYWEYYFTKNPTLRPKHIYYYDGDPTMAVFEFQQQNNIGRADTSKIDGQLLGFEDHHVLDMEKDPRANDGYDELVETANQIITEHYKKSRGNSF